AHRATFFARAVEKIGDQFWLNVRGAHLRPAPEGPNPVNGLPGKLHGEGVRFPEVGEARWTDIHGVAFHRELAGGIFILLRAVAYAREVGGQVFGPPVLADGDA